MKASEAYPSKYLKLSDLDGDITATIDGVAQEEIGFGNDKQDKMVVYFRDLKKALACNITNWNIIISLHGDETDDWVGKKITLFPDYDIKFGGKPVGGISIRSNPKKMISGKGGAKAKTQTSDVPENGALDLKGKLQKAIAELVVLAGSTPEKVLMEFSYFERPDMSTGEMKKYCTMDLNKVLGRNAQGEQKWAELTLVNMQEAIAKLKPEQEEEVAPI